MTDWSTIEDSAFVSKEFVALRWRCARFAKEPQIPQMPPLYLYDDYDRCLEEFPVRATYCLVDSWIVPNDTNPLWSVIEQFSTDTKRTFRHDRLQRGLCMNRCHQLLTRFDGRTQMKYFRSRFVPIDSPEV
uniref:Uncharacterized protein n=1 Tax=Anopheles christyi TaxID=43041 RepID=A0A182JNH5_9DIPT